MGDITITPQSLKVFLAYAADAPNWGGTPLVGGNVGGGPEERGNLTQLKKAGLIQTSQDDGATFVHFTAAGEALADQHGLSLDPGRV